MSAAGQQSGKINILLAAAFSLNILLWLGSQHIYAKWQGVPPVPSEKGALIMALGDREFSFRSGAITLQSLGDEAGQTTSLREYDYSKLKSWFDFLYLLNPASDHVPMLASYYFGSSGVPRDISLIVDYLARVGESPVGSKWRWLAQAAFMARHKLNDLDLALDLSYKLSKMEPVGDALPDWARRMPVFMLTARGEKEDARRLMEEMLLTSESFHPNEVNFMKAYLVETLGVPADEVEQMMRMRKSPVKEVAPKMLPAPMP